MLSYLVLSGQNMYLSRMNTTLAYLTVLGCQWQHPYDSYA